MNLKELVYFPANLANEHLTKSKLSGAICYSIKEIKFFEPYKSYSDIAYRALSIVTAAPLLALTAASFAISAALFLIAAVANGLAWIFYLIKQNPEQAAAYKSNTAEAVKSSVLTHFFAVYIALTAIASPIVNLISLFSPFAPGQNSIKTDKAAALNSEGFDGDEDKGEGEDVVRHNRRHATT